MKDLSNLAPIRKKIQKMQSNRPTISIVVCAFNEEKYILPCLESISNLHTPEGESLEIIFVDNASSDRTQEVLVASGVKVVYERNKGLVNARFAGIRSANGSIILQTDADTRVPVDWVESHLKQYKGGVVGCIGPFVFDRSMHVIFRIYFYFAHLRGRHVSETGGANLSFKRSVALREARFLMEFHDAGEDLRLCHRLQNYGNVVRIEKNQSPVITSGRKFRGLCNGLGFLKRRLLAKISFFLGLPQESLDIWNTSIHHFEDVR